jgi:hypothetical protein
LIAHDLGSTESLPPENPNPHKPSKGRAFFRWLADKTVGAVITTVVAGVVAGIVVFGHSDKPESPEPPTLASQWLVEKAKIARKGWRIAQKRVVDLRGVGEPSTVLVLDPPPKSCLDSTRTRAQQIRVYDVDDGWLEEELKFEPTLRGGCPQLEFEFVRVAPLREYDDTPLILGSFSGGLRWFGEEVSIPVVLAWNDRTRGYRLAPLLVRPPRLITFIYRDGRPITGGDRSWYRAAKRTFEQPIDLGSGVRGYAVSRPFAVGRMYSAVGDLILAGVYRLTAGNAGKGEQLISSPVVHQRAVWSLGTTPEGALYAGECSLSRRMTQEFPPKEDLATELLERAGGLVIGCAEY